MLLSIFLAFISLVLTTSNYLNKETFHYSLRIGESKVVLINKFSEIPLSLIVKYDHFETLIYQSNNPNSPQISNQRLNGEINENRHISIERFFGQINNTHMSIVNADAGLNKLRLLGYTWIGNIENIWSIIEIYFTIEPRIALSLHHSLNLINPVYHNHRIRCDTNDMRNINFLIDELTIYENTIIKYSISDIFREEFDEIVQIDPNVQNLNINNIIFSRTGNIMTFNAKNRRSYPNDILHFDFTTEIDNVPITITSIGRCITIKNFFRITFDGNNEIRYSIDTIKSSDYYVIYGYDGNTNIYEVVGSCYVSTILGRCWRNNMATFIVTLGRHTIKFAPNHSHLVLKAVLVSYESNSMALFESLQIQINPDGLFMK